MNMKMSDVFELPINGACVHVNFHKLKDNYNDGVTPFDAIDVAINNHDRLTSENALLREVLESIVAESDNSWIDIDACIVDAKQLLTKLEKGDE